MGIAVLEERYASRVSTVLPILANALEAVLEEIVAEYPRIDQVAARYKQTKTFLEKARRQENGKAKYSDPIHQIHDQLGARVVTYFKSDIGQVNELVKSHIPTVEEVEVIPDSEREFDYSGYHHVMLIPEAIITPEIAAADHPIFFELQISTLFEHAWAQANHDLGYKPVGKLSKEQKRKVAFTAAQSWGADLIFDELLNELG